MSRHTFTVISERIAILTYRLAKGEQLKASSLARELKVDRRTIYRDLHAISRVVPIYSDYGLWRICDGSEAHTAVGYSFKLRPEVIAALNSGEE